MQAISSSNQGATRSALGGQVSGTQRERFAKLQRAFKRVEFRLQTGMPVRRAVRIAARHLSAQKYSSGKPVRFSEQRLATLFYRRRAIGDAALVTHYKPAKSSVPADCLSAFLKECMAPDVRSMAEARRRLNGKCGASVNCFYRALSPAQRKTLREYHKAMARARRLRRDLVAWEEN